MRQCKIKDNSIVLIDELHQIPKVTNGVANKTLEQLEKEGVFVFPETLKNTEDLTKEQMILQTVNDTYRSSNVMGFIGVDDQRLVIQSRFSKCEEDFFFQYLLEKVMDYPNFVDLETEANDENQMFNLLVFIFPRFLKSALRKGPYKTYVRREYNDSNVRGTIQVARHIKQNSPFVGNIAYSQREQSYDNDMMELIRHTIEYIKGKPYGNRLLRIVKDEVDQVFDVTPGYRVDNRKKVIDANKKNTIRHAYYHEYRDLQRLCILILQNQKQQMGAGANKVYGILFDGAWLWEEYVNLLISDYFYHPMNKAGSGAQRLFAGNIGLIYPDFIGKDVNNRIIADAKYKPIENIASKDYLQVLAYMFRFDAKKAYYMYPNAEGEDDLSLWMNQGSTYEKVTARDDVNVIKHGLRIPDGCDTYEAFTEEMKVSENEFKDKICDCM